MGIAIGFEPRLFHCSNCQGYFHMKEIYNYSQTDLNNNDVMVLDVYSTMYLWIGRHSNATEKKNVRAKVQKYVDNLTDGRDKEKIQFVELEPCSEPSNFTTHFPEWEDEVSEQWLQPDPYTALQEKIAAERKAHQDAKWGGKNEESKFLDPETNKFELEELQKGTPEGVPPNARQKYLKPDVFQTTFGMSMEDFEKLKDWKQKELKKKVKLF
mmetsp:Transcript_35945/g.55229  ORF Transcript_35945/g.55229 Transcript_35945/m.55229 type:complete len:212 (+) Transcript_35945:1909-2544(+)